jgi:hypothetical protein
MFDLEAAIAGMIEKEQAAQEARKQAAALEKQKREQHRQDGVTKALRETIPSDVQSAFGMRIEKTDFEVEVVFELDGQVWKLSPYKGSPGWGWRIFFPTHATLDVSADALIPTLLRAIGNERERIRIRAEDDAERERVRAAREAEHQRCQERISQAEAEALESAWQWTEGAYLVLYRWQWCTAAGAEGAVEYEYAWSEFDRLNAAGYVELKIDDQIGGPKMVRLDMQAHKTVVTRYAFNDARGLPAQLTEFWEIKIKGISAEPEDYLVEDEKTTYHHRMPHRRPIQWVRDLIAARTP